MTEQFSTADVIRYLLRYRWLIIVSVVTVTAGTYIYLRTLPEYFKSTINCVPPVEEGGGLGGMLGGLSSSLKDVGLSKLGGKAGETYEFIALLFSRTIRDSMVNRFDLTTEYNMQGETRADVIEEFEDNLEVNFRAEGNYEISMWSKDPKKAVEMCNAFVEYANEMKNRVKRQEAAKAASYYQQRIAMMDSVLTALSDSLSEFSRTYRLFSPLDQAQASAKALAESKAELLKQEIVLGVLEQNYGKDDPQVKATRNMVRTLAEQYEKAQTQPGFAGNFALTDATGVGAKYLRMYADFEAHTKLKAFLMPSLEQAQLDMNKTSPALLVIDYPVPAEERDKPKRMFVSVGSGMGIGILIILILLSLRGWRTMMSGAPKNS